MREKSDHGNWMRGMKNHVDGMSDHSDMMKNSDHGVWVRGRSNHGD